MVIVSLFQMAGNPSKTSELSLARFDPGSIGSPG